MNANPTPSDTLRVRADLLGEVGRWREAIPLLQSALGLDPDDARLHCRMAQAQLKVGDTARAMKSAERAIALNPSDEWGHRLRCIILLKGQDKRRVLQAAEKAAALAPESARSLHVLVQALLKIGKLDQARQTAERLRQTAPQSSLAHEALALVALRQGQWIEAEIHCRAMLKINPQSYAAFHNLGLALRFSKRMPEAIESFREAQRLDPVDATVRRQLNAVVLDYLFYLVYPILSCAGVLAFLALLPLGNRATYGPVWVHIIMFCLAALLIGTAAYLVRQRLRRLPPAARRLLARKKWWHDGSS